MNGDVTLCCPTGEPGKQGCLHGGFAGPNRERARKGKPCAAVCGCAAGGHGGAGADGSIRSGGRPRGVSRLQSSAMEKTRAQPLLEGGTPAGRCGGAAQYQAVQVLISNESCTSQDDSWDGAPGEAWAEFHRVN